MGFDVGAATWVASITEADLGRLFDTGSLDRGRRYAAAGHVRSVVTADRGRMLLAEVAGTRSHPYQTLITVTSGPSAPLAVTCRCSCPVASPCKHAAATLLVVRDELATALAEPVGWEERLLALTGPDTDGAANGADPVGIVPLALAVEVLTRAGNHGDGRPQRVIGLSPMRRTRVGSWSSTTTWSEVVSWSERSAMSVRRDHAEALVALLDMHRGRSVFGVRTEGAVTLDGLGPGGWPLLVRAAKLGVELIGADPNVAVRLVESPVDLVADVYGQDGGLRLTTRFDGLDRDGGATAAARQVVVLGQPAHGAALVAPEEIVLAPLDLSTGPIEPGLLDLAVSGDAIDVPATAVDRFVSVHLPRLRSRVTVVSSDELLESTVTPVRLVVRVDTTSAHEVSAAFFWGYPGTDDDTELVPVDRIDPVRDRRAEQAILDDPGVSGALGTMGLVTRDLLGERHVVARRVFTAHDARRFVCDVVPALEVHPHVMVLPIGVLTAYHHSEADPVIEVSALELDGTDWLDLRVTVTLDDEEVPFEGLFAALARGDEAMLLDSGTWFALDHPALTALRALIDEARELTDRDRPGLAIDRHQVGLWEEFVDLGATAEASGAWARSVAALREGVPPILPAALRATLRPYQREGYAWLCGLWSAGLGGILADDMGLGKTLQALALIAWAAERGDLTTPVLVVAPTSVVGAWAGEAGRFTPDLDVRVISHTGRIRDEPLSDLSAGAHIVVTSYSVLRLDADDFAAVPWRGVILDEAQFVKNPASKTHRAVRRLGSPFVLAITGTPLENSLMDLWALLALTAPGLFPRPDTFSSMYRRPIESGRAPELLDRLRRRIRPLMLRRTKALVAADLPIKQVHVMALPLHPVHQRIYQRHLQRERQRILGLLDDPAANRVAILASLTTLRQLALDPVLVDEELAGRTTSVKIDALVEHLREITAEGHRALVFSQFTRFLRRVEAALTAAGLATCYLDGSTADRAGVIESWRSGDSAAFLISLKAGGFGLTLTEADYVFVLDPWWNPAAEAQAIDRAHRIGQDKRVIVYRMVSADTIEEKVIALQERKRDLFTRVVDEGGSLSGTITPDEVRALLTD